MQAIRTVGLVKRYKNIIAVDGLNLEIMDGELFSLLGCERSGKDHHYQNALLPDGAYRR